MNAAKYGVDRVTGTAVSMLGFDLDLHELAATS